MIAGPRAQHEHHSFLHPSLRCDGHAEFVELAADMSAGLAVCMELVLSSTNRREALLDNPNYELPPLNTAQTEELMRFAITSAKLLKVTADRRIELLNDRVKSRGAV
jgi:hypothetical protein